MYNIHFNINPETDLVALKSFLDSLNHAPSPIIHNSNDLTSKNKAYLAANGKAKTPQYSGHEALLRSSIQCANWDDIQLRREALLSVGYDIFNTARNLGEVPVVAPKQSEEAGQVFADEIDLSEVPE